MAKALLASYIEPDFRHKYGGCESAKMMWSTFRKNQKKNRAEYFHHINDNIQSLQVVDFPSVINFNEKFKFFLSDLILSDTEGQEMNDMEATYILLRVLPTKDESWRMFGQIQASMSKPQVLMDKMLRYESSMKSDKRNAGA
ncbi:hypothetical protein L873DRAFT_1794469 [Choiromyces venosus 120613-1]|uniref:Uncharacterized protein n=1 Tax=Choiromyces venosus 120613-1 TaxID=1336337 RepID=A0A3N4J4A2_9PEZI|nr:hypothetical protein L873DRAFT_1794469 [Choiromyces venosus 120613-1]